MLHNDINPWMIWAPDPGWAPTGLVLVDAAPKPTTPPIALIPEALIQAAPLPKMFHAPLVTPHTTPAWGQTKT